MNAEIPDKVIAYNIYTNGVKLGVTGKVDTITLDSQFGESPRVTLALINKMVEEGRVDYLIIGSMPVGMCQYKMTDVSDDWEEVVADGKLARCKVEITLEEYV